MVDARIKGGPADGARVNAVIPPLAIDGPILTIRKFRKDVLTIQSLIDNGTLTPAVADFLKACVQARLNIIVSGGTGSGKTTLLNVLSNFISEGDRIVTVEDSAELQIQKRHVLRLETKPATADQKEDFTIRKLIKNTLRMRPNRIVVGECRGEEALDMLQAMNTGHDGCLTTIHANSPGSVVSRLEIMVLLSGFDIPVRAVRQLIVDAIHLIIQTERVGRERRVTSIAEVAGLEQDGPVTVREILGSGSPASSDQGGPAGPLERTGEEFRAAGRVSAFLEGSARDILRPRKGEVTP